MSWNAKFRTWSLVLGLTLLLAVGLACSVSETVVHAAKAESGEQKILAMVGGVPVTEEEVEAAVAGELLRLARERHQALERGLEQVMAQKLVEVEAAERGLSPEELLAQEVDEKLVEPTDEDVDAFFEARKAQIRQPKEQIAGRIRDRLRQQRYQEAHQGLIERLKKEHGYESFLEPLRLLVDAEDSPAKGPEGAPVTIVEFSDFQCTYCSRVVPTLEKIQRKFGDKVRLVFRQFPLRSIHPLAQKAAEASLCAHDQQKFWKMHDAMFEDQKRLGVEQLKATAERLGLDTEAFNECLDSSRHAARIDDDVRAGTQAGVTGTPAIFINGRFLSGAQPYDAIAKLIGEELDRPSDS